MVEIIACQSAHYQTPLTTDTYTLAIKPSIESLWAGVFLHVLPQLHVQQNDPLSLQPRYTAQHYLSPLISLVTKLVNQQTLSFFFLSLTRGERHSEFLAHAVRGVFISNPTQLNPDMVRVWANTARPALIKTRHLAWSNTLNPFSLPTWISAQRQKGLYITYMLYNVAGANCLSRNLCSYHSHAAPALHLNWHRLGERLSRGRRHTERQNIMQKCGPYTY